MPNVIIPPPTLDIEQALLLKGISAIVGADEVGVGALAGPIIVGMVQLPLPLPSDTFERDLAGLLHLLAGVRDTSHLRRRDWGYWAEEIGQVGEVSIGQVTSDELNAGLSARQALDVAYQRALDALPQPPQVLLIDGGIPLPPLSVPMQRVPKTHDTPSLSIACAAIVAALRLSQIMQEYDLQYPGYDFARHRGYSSPAHLQALAERGPSPIHRKNNIAVQSILQAQQGNTSD